MRSIPWHVQRGSEVVVREEHLRVKLKALLFLINSFPPLMLQRSNYQRGKQTHTFFSLPRQLQKCVFYVVNLEVSVSPWLDTVFIQDFLDLMFKTA